MLEHINLNARTVKQSKKRKKRTRTNTNLTIGFQSQDFPSQTRDIAQENFLFNLLHFV